MTDEPLGTQRSRERLWTLLTAGRERAPGWGGAPVPEARVEWQRGQPWLGLLLLLWLALTLSPDGGGVWPLASYLPLHTGLEVGSVVLITLAFALLWRMPESVRRAGVLAMAVALVAAGWLDFAHLLSYQGMPVWVTPAGPEKAIAFWLLSRGVMLLGLLAVAFIPITARAGAGSRHWALATTVVVVSLATWGVLQWPSSLPRTFIPGQGLTPTKLAAESLLVLGYALAALRLRQLALRYHSVPAATVARAAALAAMAELFMASYGSVSDVMNLLGHLCKIAAQWQVVRTAYLLAVRQPLQEVAGLAEALDATLNPTSICDIEGRIRWVNQAFVSATGHALADLGGKTLAELAADPAQCLAQGCMAAMRKGVAWRGLVQTRRRDGSVFIDDRSVTPIRNAQGHLTGFVIVSDDVTERARATQAVQDNEERLRTLLQCAPDAVVVIDNQGHIQLANQQTERMFGYTAAELLGANVSLLMPMEVAARHDGYLHRYARTGESHIIGRGRDVVATRKDGTPLQVSLTVGEARLASGVVYIGFIRDIADRIVAQRELAEREARYRALMDTALDGVWIASTTGRLIAVNDAYARLSGYSREELMRMRIEDVDADESAQAVSAHVAKAMAQGNDQFESRHRTKAGVIWPVEVTMTYWPLGDGQLFVFVRDLTQRKAAERALRFSEERFELALRGANDGLWDRNLIDDSVYYSPRWKEMLGYRDEELANHRSTFAALLHPDDALRVHLMLSEAASGNGGERFEIELRMHHRQGHWVHVLSRGQLVRNEHGTPIRLIGTHQDLTDKKAAEQVLRESEEKLRKLFELSPLGIALCTLDGSLVDFNEAYRNLSGYPAHTLRQMTYWDLTPREYAPSEGLQLDTLAHTGRYGPYEKEYRRMDGSLMPVRLNGVLLELDGRPHIWSIVEDLTQSRQLQAERDALQQHQLQSQKLEALGYLAGGVAHDFNNMLAGIMGLASLALERYAGDADGKLAKFLGEIVRTSERGRDLVAKMLAYARTEEPAPVEARDIAPLVSELRDMLQGSIPSGIRLEATIAGGLPPVKISAVDVHQVVMNLVINARDAIGQHGRIEVALREQLDEQGNCLACGERTAGRFVVLEVRDDGTGIPESIRSKIFDPFFTTKGVGRGTGLGLSSVLGIVHNAGGHMQIEPAVPCGTVMRVLLPVAAPRAEEPEPKVDALAVVPTLSRTVWVVDDDPAVLVFLSELLRDQGYDVRPFADPLKLLATLRRAVTRPRAIITDQTMPGLSGAQLAAVVLNEFAGIEVILCTGYSEHLDPDRALAMGIRHFLTKPFDSRQLLGALRQCLADASGEE